MKGASRRSFEKGGFSKRASRRGASCFSRRGASRRGASRFSQRGLREGRLLVSRKGVI